MMAPWDEGDTREVAKAAAVALVTTAVIELVKWGVEELLKRQGDA